MRLMANLANKNDAKTRKMTETPAHGYSTESTQQEPSNIYQHDRFSQYLCMLVFGTKVVSALKYFISRNNDGEDN